MRVAEIRADNEINERKARKQRMEALMRQGMGRR